MAGASARVTMIGQVVIFCEDFFGPRIQQTADFVLLMNEIVDL